MCGMKIGIMQPYFVPYIGYWQLMDAVDRYVIYDDVDFIKRGWINRNRILLNGQPHYINVQMLGASQSKPINEIRVSQDKRAISKNLRMIEHAYKKAPYYTQVQPIIEKILLCDDESLSNYIVNSFSILCNYMDIKTELVLSSSLDKDCTLKAQDKILEICEVLGATEYYNPIGGRNLYSFDVFKKRGIRLRFLKTDEILYHQFDNEFCCDLSIIDVMMFNSREQVKKMLSSYTLICE